MWTLANRLVKLGALLTAVCMVLAGAAEARSIPRGNLTRNPSFSKSIHGWSGMESKVKRVPMNHAPNGSKVALVRATAGADSYTLDDSPSTVSNNRRSGTAYVGSAWVRGTRSNRGKRISIVVREWSAGGEYLDSNASTRRLRGRGFRRLRVSYTAERANSQIDVYIDRSKGGVARGDRFYADAVTLTKRDASAGGEGPTGPAPVNPTGGITTSQIAIVSSEEDELFTESDARYRYILIRDNLHDRVEELRRLHPEAELILYKNVGFTLHEPGCPYEPFQGGGVSYCDADPHEDWFLHDSSGNRLSSEGYPAQRAMNIANPGYQQEWLSSVLARLRDAENDGSGVRYDGVWLDDTNTYPGHGMDGRISELTDSQYGDAMVGFIHDVSPQLQAAGFTTIANVGMNPWETEERADTLRIAGDVSAINREGLIRWGEGQTWTSDGAAPHWMYEVELAEDIQAAGAAFHAITYGGGGDVQAQRYARATFLLAWNGNDGSAFNYRTTDDGPSWLPDWTTDLGVPTSARYAVGQGWRRDFAGGTVIINPAESGGQRFDLGGSFRRPDGSCTDSLTVPATQAMVMPSC